MSMTPSPPAFGLQSRDNPVVPRLISFLFFLECVDSSHQVTKCHFTTRKDCQPVRQCVRSIPCYYLSPYCYPNDTSKSISTDELVMLRECQRYMRRKSDAVVIRLHIGQSLDSRQRNQHSLQHVCQHWVETVGSVYGSRQIRLGSR